MSKSTELTPILAPRKTWTEWLQAFLEADAQRPAYDEAGNPIGTFFDDHDHGAADDGWQTLGGDYDDLQFDEDGLIESLMIIGAAALLMILVVYRRRRQDERERERLGLPPGAPLPGQQQQGGLFPQPGDAAFPDWAAGGVGH